MVRLPVSALEEPQPAWRRWCSALRAVEWAGLAFLAFVFARGGLGMLGGFRQFAGLRTVAVFCAFGAVAAAALIARLRRQRWPPEAEGFRRLWLALGAVALLPLLFALYAGLTGGTLRHEVPSLRLAQAIPVVANVALQVLGFGLPTILLWAAVGAHVQAHGSLDARRFVTEAGRAVLHDLREWAPLLLIFSGYAWMAALFRGHDVHDFDEQFAAIDRALFFGRDPLELLEQLISRPLSEWLALAYSAYAVLIPLVLGAVLLRGGDAAVREASFTVGISLLLAYVSYALLPVKGPVLSREFSVSLEIYAVAAVKEAMMDATRVTYDCFPSMHTCTTLLLSRLAWRHVRGLFWLTLPVVVSIPFACVYLRYHYVVDVLAGVALAAAMIAADVRWGPRLSPATPLRPA